MPALFNPAAKFPTDTMKPDQIDGAATKIRKVGNSVKRTCGQVSRAWSKLPAGYDAPGDQALFAAMKPITTKSETFKGDLDDVGRALNVYADDVRRIKAAVAKIRADGKVFLQGIEPGGFVWAGSKGMDRSGGGGPRLEKWHSDGKTVDANNGLVGRMNDQLEALRRAEQQCARSIRAVYVSGALFGAGSCTPSLGGGKIEIPTGTVMPWGQEVKKTDSIGMQIVKGFTIDGPIGFAQSFTGLVGFSWNGKGKDAGFSRETLGKAWGGLFRSAMTANPGTALAAMTPGAGGDYARGLYKDQIRQNASMVGIDPFAKDPYAAWKGDEPGRVMGKGMFDLAATFTPVKKFSAGAAVTAVGTRSAGRLGMDLTPRRGPWTPYSHGPKPAPGPYYAPINPSSGASLFGGTGPTTWLDKHVNGSDSTPSSWESHAGSTHKSGEPNSYRTNPSFGESGAGQADKPSNSMPKHAPETSGRADHHPPSKEPNPAPRDPAAHEAPHRPPTKDPNAPFRMPDQVHGKDVGPLTSETNTGRPGEAAPAPRQQELDPKR
ncbi:hypothetical protein ACQBAR_11555 [Propionibacteriaceae bacterium Y1685]